jgi:hypothetical protein
LEESAAHNSLYIGSSNRTSALMFEIHGEALLRDKQGDGEEQDCDEADSDQIHGTSTPFLGNRSQKQRSDCKPTNGPTSQKGVSEGD